MGTLRSTPWLSSWSFASMVANGQSSLGLGCPKARASTLRAVLRLVARWSISASCPALTRVRLVSSWYTEIQKKLQDEIPVYLKALGLPEDALPLLWAADFIPLSDHKSPLVIGEFNCSCLGLAGFLNVRGGDIKDIKKEDEEMGMAMANLIGEKALEALKAKK